ncbi:MAG: ATP-binding protein, partial [Candidatus Heimdallarchaeaceae archaeon]
ITGSNSQLLSGEPATALTGRYISFELFPFSFREYLTYNDVKITGISIYSTKKISRIKNLLTKFLKIGGLPEAYLFGREIIVKIYGDIIEKDIIKRLKIRKRIALKELAQYLISSSACEITFRKLSHILDIKDIHTIKNWIDGLREAYLVILLERFSPKLKQQVIAPKKVYTIDNGIINTIGFKISENLGKTIENLVAIELFRRHSYWYPEWEIFYFKDYQRHEVDFVVKEGLRVKQLIQVTYASGTDEVDRRELKALIKASELLKCKDLLVITWDLEDEMEFKGERIKFMPLWKWLL